jgi:phosphatidylglycerol:prolipoprotein diacylglycerol transferase
MLVHPNIDPIAFNIGPFFGIGPLPVRWYGLMYLTGFLAAWWLGMRRISKGLAPVTRQQFDDMLFLAVIGVILGGRLGYILFYKPAEYLAHPLKIFAVWEGGMSFHGGLLGTAVAVWLFCRRRKLSLLSVADLACAFAPIGLFFGRVANFINGELWGRATDVPWAMIFPRGGPIPRHPSQLYEAALEGVLLFLLLQIALRAFRAHERPGLISALFFAGYGTFRFICEFYREPDTQFIGPLSMGMALSIPVWLAAAALFWIATRKPKAA